ncbi:hypothetical protein ASF82_04915 [Frigoribacterium sp. Leaf164]|nr:hypothetical protein ASF82_04915 [Frigoribacterium sp. Leaf164]
MLRALEAVDARLGAVAQQQAVLQEVVLDRSDGAEHPRVVGGDEAHLGELQQRGVDLGRAVVLGVRAPVGVPALLLDLGTDLVAEAPPPVDGSVEPELLDALDGAVEGGPDHDARVGEVLRFAADLPDAVVGAGPVVLDVLHQGALQRP